MVPCVYPYELGWVDSCIYRSRHMRKLFSGFWWGVLSRRLGTLRRRKSDVYGSQIPESWDLYVWSLNAVGDTIVDRISGRPSRTSVHPSSFATPLYLPKETRPSWHQRITVRGSYEDPSLVHLLSWTHPWVAPLNVHPSRVFYECGTDETHRDRWRWVSPETETS